MATSPQQAAALQQERNNDRAASLPASDTKSGSISIVEALLVALFLALPNDILDAVELTGVGYLLTLPIELLTGGALILWSLMRTQTLQTRGTLRRTILTLVGEMIPIVGIAPLWTLFIAYTYLKEHGALPKPLKKIATIAVEKHQKHGGGAAAALKRTPS